MPFCFSTPIYLSATVYWPRVYLIWFSQSSETLVKFKFRGAQGSPISNIINILRIYMYIFAYDLHTRSTRSHDCVCTCRCGCTCVHVWRALRSVLMSSSAGLHLSFKTGSLTKPRGVGCPANGLQRFARPCALPDTKLYLTFEYFHACVSSTVRSKPSPQAF